MASLISGFEYDVFISYRQKDNKHDGWVTEFVDNLKGELESTFKEDISVYFDINPHDGLLETHDVDASLKDKLKCLVFIPIISRTYCDPKSFAWEYEFKAFVELASKDQFGLKVRLPDGNVANRVLPVQIHDLHIEDKAIIEKELGSLLRGIEFIYKEPGVNRPLNIYDDEKKNLKSTKYLNQINKVANAIEEIISGLKGEPIKSFIKSVDELSVQDRMIIKEKSIIVLPFENISPDPDQEYFSDGLTEEIITDLSHVQNLLVISRSSAMTFKGTKKTIPEIAREVKVHFILEGSVRKAGNNVRITAQLIDSTSDSPLWAEKFDGSLNDIFEVQERIAERIVEALKIKLSPQEKIKLKELPIKNPKAYDLWILAKNEFHKLNKEGIERGILLIKKALELEGDNAQLYATLGYMYWGAYDAGIMHEARIFDLMELCISKSLALDPNQAEALNVKGLILYKKGNLPGYVSFARPAADLGGDAGMLLSFVLAELGKLEEANTYTDRAIADDPLLYMSWWSKSCVNLFRGNALEAYNLMRDTRDRFAPGEPFVGWWVAQMAAYAGEKAIAYEEFKKVALSNSSPWGEFSKIFQLAIESDRQGVIEHIENSGIVKFSKTDEYYPIFIANALTLVGEYDKAIVWIKRSVDWGFSNHKFLTDVNEFMKPLKEDLRFKTIVEQARKQQDAFIG